MLPPPVFGGQRFVRMYIRFRWLVARQPRSGIAFGRRLRASREVRSLGSRRAGARGAMNPLRVFSARSTGIGMATGVLVAIAFGQPLGVAWSLAVLNGLAAGALALVLSIDELRGGWLDTTHDRRRTGIRALAYAVMLAPTLFADRYIAFRPADEVAVSLLFLLTGFAAYTLGGIMATLVSSTARSGVALISCCSCGRRRAAQVRRLLSVKLWGVRYDFDIKEVVERGWFADATHADVERVVRRAVKAMVLEGGESRLRLDHLDAALRRARAELQRTRRRAETKS